MNVSDFRWLPAKLFQTNITDHEESKLNMARYASQFERYFYDDNACAEYLEDTFGPDVVNHISSYKKGAHRADAFRYGLILQEGGLYLDIKIAMLDDFSRLLQEIDITGELQGEPFILTAIGVAKDHIFQGILACSPRHPLMLAAWEHMKSVRQSHLKRNYMLFCKELYRLLKVDLEVDQLKPGLHHTHTYGTVYLLQEQRRRKQPSIVDADGKMIPMDGHVICDEATLKPWFATRCWGWSHGFPTTRERSCAIAEALQDTGTRITEAASKQPELEAPSVISVLSEGESGTLEDMISYVQGSNWYSSLTLEEVVQFWTDGMILHPALKSYLTCRHCMSKGKFKEFQSADTLRNHFTTFGWHKQARPVEPQEPQEQVPCDMGGAFPCLKGVWEEPSDVEECLGTSSAQPGTTPILAIEDTKTVCYDIVTGDCEAWLHAFVLVHIAVDRRFVEWTEGCKHLAAVPRQFRSTMDEMRTDKGCTWAIACNVLSAARPDMDSFMLNNESVSRTGYLGILRTLLQRAVNAVLTQHWLPAETTVPNVACLMALINTYAQAENIGLRIFPKKGKGNVATRDGFVEGIVIDKDFLNPSSRGGSKRTSSASGPSRMKRLHVAGPG